MPIVQINTTLLVSAVSVIGAPPELYGVGGSAILDIELAVAIFIASLSLFWWLEASRLAADWYTSDWV
jgi:hypothetical protein